jgi:hypothetical protein
MVRNLGAPLIWRIADSCGFRGMPINVPNYNRETDRHQLGTLIGITSES